LNKEKQLNIKCLLEILRKKKKQSIEIKDKYFKLDLSHGSY